jgi:hypothetical protein
MTYKNNNLFDFLNFIFKSSDKEVKEYNPPIYLINRWITMANPIFAKIVNLTSNRWLSNNNDFDFTKFYRIVLPKHKHKISYIKKKEKTKIEEENDLELANFMECSQRELDLFKDTIDFLKQKNK